MEQKESKTSKDGDAYTTGKKDNSSREKSNMEQKESKLSKDGMNYIDGKKDNSSRDKSNIEQKESKTSKDREHYTTGKKDNSRREKSYIEQKESKSSKDGENYTAGEKDNSSRRKSYREQKESKSSKDGEDYTTVKYDNSSREKYDMKQKESKSIQDGEYYMAGEKDNSRSEKSSMEQKESKSSKDGEYYKAVEKDNSSKEKSNMEQKESISSTDGEESMTDDENKTYGEKSNMKQNGRMSRKDEKDYKTGAENNSCSENNDLKQKRCTSPKVRHGGKTVEVKYLNYEKEIQNRRILQEDRMEVYNCNESNIAFGSTDACQKEIKFQEDRDVITSGEEKQYVEDASNDANLQRCKEDKKESCDDSVERAITIPDSKADTKTKHRTEKIKDKVQSQTIIQLSMAHITVAILGVLSASVLTQTIFFSVIIKRQEQGQLTSAGYNLHSCNDSIRAHFDFVMTSVTDKWKEIEMQNKTISDILTSSIQSVESIHDLTNKLTVLNASIQNVFETMNFTEVYLAGVNKCYHNLTIPYSVLFGKIRHIISSIASLNNKWDEIQFIFTELNGSISEDIFQRSLSEKQRKFQMDRQTRRQQEILTTSLDFRHLLLLLFGVVELTVLLVFCTMRFNGVIQQQRNRDRKALGRCRSCQNGAICFLEISLHDKGRSKDDYRYRELSEGVMEDMDMKYCHLSITCREDLDSIPTHQTYLLFIELTICGGLLETQYDLSDFKRSVVKCLMERSDNVLIVATKHNESQQLLDNAILSPELKCIKGDDVLEELKGKRCLLSIKDTFSDLQKNHIRSVLLKD